MKIIWCMHIQRGQFNPHTVFRTHTEEISILAERGKKPNHRKTSYHLLVMFMLFTVRIKWFRERSDPPWLSLSTDLEVQTVPHYKLSDTCSPKILLSPNLKSPLPCLQPHYEIRKCIKLMFWHTSIVHLVSLFLPKEFHVSRFVGWVVCVWSFF